MSLCSCTEKNALQELSISEDHISDSLVSSSLGLHTNVAQLDTSELNSRDAHEASGSEPCLSRDQPIALSNETVVSALHSLQQYQFVAQDTSELRAHSNASVLRHHQDTSSVSSPQSSAVASCSENASAESEDRLECKRAKLPMQSQSCKLPILNRPALSPIEAAIIIQRWIR